MLYINYNIYIYNIYYILIYSTFLFFIMKTSKLFTIDVDLAERLKNINASKIVNELLKEYFEIRSDKNSVLEEKQAVLEQLRKKKGNFLRMLRLLLSSIRSGLILLVKDGLKLVNRSHQKEKLKSTSKDESYHFSFKTL